MSLSSLDGLLPSTFKKLLAGELPQYRSAHLTEAMAAGCGYPNQAAYKEDLRTSKPVTFLETNRVDSQAMAYRLASLVGTSGNATATNAIVKDVVQALIRIHESVEGDIVPVGIRSSLMPDLNKVRAQRLENAPRSRSPEDQQFVDSLVDAIVEGADNKDILALAMSRRHEDPSLVHFLAAHLRGDASNGIKGKAQQLMQAGMDHCMASMSLEDIHLTDLYEATDLVRIIELCKSGEAPESMVGYVTRSLPTSSHVEDLSGVRMHELIQAEIRHAIRLASRSAACPAPHVRSGARVVKPLGEPRIAYTAENQSLLIRDLLIHTEYASRSVQDVEATTLLAKALAAICAERHPTGNISTDLLHRLVSLDVLWALGRYRDSATIVAISDYLRTLPGYDPSMLTPSKELRSIHSGRYLHMEQGLLRYQYDLFLTRSA